jgi:hypothetical protein
LINSFIHSLSHSFIHIFFQVQELQQNGHLQQPADLHHDPPSGGGSPPRPVRPVPQGYETGGEIQAFARRYWEKDMPHLSKVSFKLG